MATVMTMPGAFLFIVLGFLHRDFEMHRFEKLVGGAWEGFVDLSRPAMHATH